MTKHPELFAALAAAFDPSEVKKRTQSGRELHYITARTVMNRLDDVLGPENWFDEYTPGEHSVLCKLTIRLPDGSLLAKCDAGGYAGMADEGDDDKSGFSDSFKRAAVKFGVARYLYRDGLPGFAKERAPEPSPAPATNGHAKERDKWGNPKPADPPRTNHEAGPPRSGRALFAWVKDAEKRLDIGVLKYINSWAVLQEWPARMIDWDAHQVELAFAEITRKLSTLESQEAGS